MSIPTRRGARTVRARSTILVRAAGWKPGTRIMPWTPFVTTDGRGSPMAPRGSSRTNGPPRGSSRTNGPPRGTWGSRWKTSPRNTASSTGRFSPLPSTKFTVSANGQNEEASRLFRPFTAVKAPRWVFVHPFPARTPSFQCIEMSLIVGAQTAYPAVLGRVLPKTGPLFAF